MPRPGWAGRRRARRRPLRPPAPQPAPPPTSAPSGVCHGPARTVAPPPRGRAPPLAREPAPARASARRWPGPGPRRCRSGGTWRGRRRLPLGVLRRLTGLLQPVLLTLGGPGVPGQEPRLLDLWPQVGVEGHERPGDSEPHGPRLPADPSARQRAIHVVDLGRLREAQRLGHDLAVRSVRKEVFERPLVAHDHPGPGAEPHPRHRFLAPSGGLDEGLRHFDGLLVDLRYDAVRALRAYAGWSGCGCW